MDKALLKEKILKIFSGKKLACLATLKDGKPWVRYVMTGSKELDLYVATALTTRKVAEIKKDKHVHLTMGFDQSNPHSPYVQVAGTAEILTDDATKKEFWSDMLKVYFKGPDDPAYCVIKITPELIEYWATMEPEVYIC
ncbi:MAG: pyridoxamine 5'-phosphate oxidase family protein [Candidatus Eremiobacterota bacterium]